MNDPNKFACQCNILVTTPVMGADVSITRHFRIFIAIFHNRVVTCMDAQQFSRRLQGTMESLPEGVICTNADFLSEHFLDLHRTRQVILKQVPRLDRPISFLEHMRNTNSLLNTTIICVIVE